MIDVKVGTPECIHKAPSGENVIMKLQDPTFPAWCALCGCLFTAGFKTMAIPLVSQGPHKKKKKKKTKWPTSR